MSNSKSDQTVTGNPKAIKIQSNLPVQPARKVTQGAKLKCHLQARPRAIFILKSNFKKLTAEKNT